MKTVRIALWAALVLYAGAAEAQTYGSRAAFTAALNPGSTTITFDGFVGTSGYPSYNGGTGYASSTGYTLAGVTFDARGISPYNYSYIFNPPSGYALAGSSDGMFDQLGGRFTLGVTANAFGFDFGSSSGSGAFTATVLMAGGVSVIEPLIVQGQTSFFGYVGAGAIQSVTLRDPTNSAGYIKFDNVTYGGAPMVSGAVPEPASWVLMLGGFAAAGMATRRRTGRTVPA